MSPASKICRSLNRELLTWKEVRSRDCFAVVPQAAPVDLRDRLHRPAGLRHRATAAATIWRTLPACRNSGGRLNWNPVGLPQRRPWLCRGRLVADGIPVRTVCAAGIVATGGNAEAPGQPVQHLRRTAGDDARVARADPCRNLSDDVRVRSVRKHAVTAHQASGGNRGR